MPRVISTLRFEGSEYFDSSKCQTQYNSHATKFDASSIYLLASIPQIQLCKLYTPSNYRFASAPPPLRVQTASIFISSRLVIKLARKPPHSRQPGLAHPSSRCFVNGSVDPGTGLPKATLLIWDDGSVRMNQYTNLKMIHLRYPRSDESQAAR